MILVNGWKKWIEPEFVLGEQIRDITNRRKKFKLSEVKDDVYYFAPSAPYQVPRSEDILEMRNERTVEEELAWEIADLEKYIQERLTKK